MTFDESSTESVVESHAEQPYISIMLIRFVITSLLVTAPTAFTSAFASVSKAISGTDLVSNRSISIEIKSDQPTVVVFVSSSCPCSAAHEATLKKLHAEFGSKFHFVAIHSNQDESIEDAKKHFTASNLPFSVLQDDSAKIANSLGALKTPHVFVLRGDEVLYQGGVDDSTDPAKAEKNYLQTALTEIMAGKKPTTDQARALGCIIKR